MMKKLLMIVYLLFYPNIFYTIAASDIHKAVKNSDVIKVKTILSSDKSQLNARDFVGYTPLHLAAIYARWDIFHFLIEQGAEVNAVSLPNSTPLHCACQHDSPDMVEHLLLKGAIPSLKIKDRYGEYTPMLRAVQRGCKKVIVLLFKYGADPGETTKEGWNALHLAAKCGHRDLYDVLIKNGVSENSRDSFGKTPMEYDFQRPKAIQIDTPIFQDYVGNYTWKDAPEGLGVCVFMKDGNLMLDDYSLNMLYPIDKDTFYCCRDPWKIRFLRKDNCKVDKIELTFLRRTVVLDKIVN